jgi:hypothetical protein
MYAAKLYDDGTWLQDLFALELIQIGVFKDDSLLRDE